VKDFSHLFCSMENTFDHRIIVLQADLDHMNHVNNVVYVQWVQDAASAHWNSVFPSEFRERFNWVVLRHEIDYRSPAMLSDELIARTWVKDYDGAKSTRMVQIIRESDGNILVEAKTTWCLLSASTNRPIRISDEIKNILLVDTF
jgi:acyl-CoA thioester hydrolase